MVEISVVILIIGVLLASVTQGVILIGKSRVKSARVLTNNSRVPSIKGLAFWFETSLKESFSKTDAVDGRTVSQWNDTNPHGSELHAKSGQKTDDSLITYNTMSGATASNTSGPTYIENGINHIPTLRFTNDATNKFNYMVLDESMKVLSNGGLTMFMVIKYSGGSGGYMVGKACKEGGVAVNCYSVVDGPLYNQEFFMGIVGDQFRYCAKSDDGTVQGTIGRCPTTGKFLTQGKNYIVELQRDYKNNINSYVNGALITTTTDPGDVITIAPFQIGRIGQVSGWDDLDFDISEFIFYQGPIRTRDRRSVEDYLSKKYNIPLDR